MARCTGDSHVHVSATCRQLLFQSAAAEESNCTANHRRQSAISRRNRVNLITGRNLISLLIGTDTRHSFFRGGKRNKEKRINEVESSGKAELN